MSLDGVRAWRPFLGGLLLVNVALRLPSLWQDLPPLLNCDEELYAGGSWTMLLEGTLRPAGWLAGGVNFYLPALFAWPARALFADAYTLEAHVVLCRVLVVAGLGSLTPLVVALTADRFLSRRVAVFSGVIATLSPMALGLGRMHYPDHYIGFFTAALLFAAWAIARSSRPTGAYLAAGALLGVAAATKYSGGFYVVLILAGHWLRCRSLRRGWGAYLLSPDLVSAGLAAGAAFVALNPYVFAEWDKLQAALAYHRDHYAAGHQGLEVRYGYGFHFELLFLTVFGLPGGVLAAVGIWRSLGWAPERLERLLLLVAPPVLLALFLGRYTIGFNRNLSGALPMMFVLLGLGADALVRAASERAWPPRVALGVLSALFLAEPLWRDAASLRNDLQPDGRLAAADWLRANLDRRSRVGYSKACWGVPIHPGDFPVRLLPMPAQLWPGECLDYYVMDSWLYEHHGLGKSAFSEPVYSEHAFLNTGGVAYTETRARQDAFLTGFREVKRFDARDHYGPTVVVFQRSTPCARPAGTGQAGAATCPRQQGPRP